MHASLLTFECEGELLHLAHEEALQSKMLASVLEGPFLELGTFSKPIPIAENLVATRHVFEFLRQYNTMDADNSFTSFARVSEMM